MMIILLTVACALKTGGERYQASDEESNHEVYAPLLSIDPNVRLFVYVPNRRVLAPDNGIGTAFYHHY